MEGWIVDYFVIAMVAGYNRSFKTHSFDILGVLRVFVFVVHDTTRRTGKAQPSKVTSRMTPPN